MVATSLLSTLASVFSTILALAVEIGLLVIALTVVKSRRPDATMPLAAGAVIQVIATLLTPLLYSIVVPRLAGSGGLSPAYAVLNVLFALVRTVAWAAILYGIVKLATPDSPGPRDPTRFG